VENLPDSAVKERLVLVGSCRKTRQKAICADNWKRRWLGLEKIYGIMLANLLLQALHFAWEAIMGKIQYHLLVNVIPICFLLILMALGMAYVGKLVN